MSATAFVESWRQGRASVGDDFRLVLAPSRKTVLSEKCRQANDWIAENAILPPYRDVQFGPQTQLGRGDQTIRVASQTGFSSFILLPLLTLLTSRRMVFVGAPGRGKTSTATLMALLAGYGPTTRTQKFAFGLLRKPDFIIPMLRSFAGRIRRWTRIRTTRCWLPKCCRERLAEPTRVRRRTPTCRSRR